MIITIERRPRGEGIILLYAYLLVVVAVTEHEETLVLLGVRVPELGGLAVERRLAMYRISRRQL
jgi:hypothetical protein